MGYYRTLFYRGFPCTFFAKFLVICFTILKMFLKYVVLPLSIRKRVIIPSDRNIRDFDEALIYVYFGSMYELIKVPLSKESSICIDVGAHYGF